MHDPWFCSIIAMQVRPLAVSENVHNPWTQGYILIKFCIHMHVNIPYPLASATTFFHGRGFAEHQHNLLCSVSRNPHISWTLWDIWIKFCILTYFNILQPLVCETLTRVCRASFWPVRPSVSVNVHNSWTTWYILIKYCTHMHVSIP